MSQRITVPLLAVASAGLLAASPALAASGTTSRSISSPRAGVTVDGVPAAMATWRTTLAFPSTWTVMGRPTTTLKLRVARNDSCQYTVTVRNGFATTDATSAEAQATAALPATGRYVLETGRRNSAAWRVIRISTPNRIRLEAVRVIRHYTDAKAGVPAGQTAWFQTRVTAFSDPGDECHAGTWRDTVGPGVGDALATERSSAYVRPAAS